MPSYLAAAAGGSGYVRQEGSRPFRKLLGKQPADGVLACDALGYEVAKEVEMLLRNIVF
jgi:hypothetical protein